MTAQILNKPKTNSFKNWSKLDTEALIYLHEYGLKVNQICALITWKSYGSLYNKLDKIGRIK